MATAVNRLIATARAEVGYIEKASNSNLDSKTANAGDNNWNKYARDLDKIGYVYNGPKNGYDWCDIFVDWCFNKTFGTEIGMKMICQPYRGAGAGCTWSMGFFKDNGRFSKTPMPGDQIFFTDDGGESSYHTGIVTKVQNGRVYTIEGNTSSASIVVANGGCVAEKSYPVGASYIAGYGHPNYSLVKDTVEKPKDEEEDDVKRYKTIAEIPGYAKATIQKLVDKKLISGVSSKEMDLNLSEDMIRIFVINDKAGLYDNV